MARPMEVIIIGAGSSGLLTAQALMMQGIKVTVYEQDASATARPRNWNFGVYWAQDPLDECLPPELARRVVDAQVDKVAPFAEQVMPLHNAQSGELLRKLPAPFSLRLQRRRFIDLITEGVDIKYGKRLQRAESNGETVTAYFEDGTEVTADLMIGAEGGQSRVRELLVGQEKAVRHDTKYVASMAVGKLSDESRKALQELHHRWILTVHPIGMFCYFGVHDAHGKDTIYSMIMSWVPESDEETSVLKGPKILEDFKQRGLKFGEPFRSAIQSLSDTDASYWHTRLRIWSPEQWNNFNGTVTLVGDAAHPMTFHRGQGLNNAIHDAASIARHIASISPSLATEFTPAARAKAISSYDAELIPRACQAVQANLNNSDAIHEWSRFMNSPLMKMGGLKDDQVEKLKQEVREKDEAIERERQNGMQKEGIAGLG